MKRKFVSIPLALLAAGGAWWFLSLPDRVVSEFAQLEGGVLEISVSVPGKVREVYVKPGEKVATGQPLLALDKSGYEARLARERESLAEIASTLPGDVLVPSPAGRHAVPGKALAALRAEEEEARKAVEAASHIFAASNLALSRFDAGAGPGKRGGPERQKLLIVRDEAAIGLKNARDAYEAASYARAKREALDKAALSGKPVPAALAARIAEYQARISRVSLAEQDLAATIVVSPESGTVAFMAAAPGVFLAAGDVPVAIAPDKARDLRVSAFFAPEAAPALETGGECFVVFPGGKEPAKGIIEAVFPPPGTGKRVAIRVVPGRDETFPAFAAGRDVSVFAVTGRIFFIPWLRKLP